MIGNILGTSINSPQLSKFRFDINVSFISGMLAGIDTNQKVSIFDPKVHTMPIGIFDDDKIAGVSTTVSGRSDVEIWMGEFEFDTNMYDITCAYTINTYLTSDSDGIWMPTSNVASVGHRHGLKIAKIVRSPTVLNPQLRIDYSPNHIISSNIATSITNYSPVWLGANVSINKNPCSEISLNNKTSGPEYGCTCPDCNNYYEYAERRPNFICNGCRMLRNAFS